MTWVWCGQPGVQARDQSARGTQFPQDSSLGAGGCPVPPRVGPGSAAKQRCSGFSPLNEMKTPKQFQRGLSLPSAYKIFISSFLKPIYSFGLTSRSWEEDDLMEGTASACSQGWGGHFQRDAAHQGFGGSSGPVLYVHFDSCNNALHNSRKSLRGNKKL